MPPFLSPRPSPSHPLPLPPPLSPSLPLFERMDLKGNDNAERMDLERHDNIGVDVMDERAPEEAKVHLQP